MKPDLREVLEHYGALYVPERHGWAGMLCPFHDDKNKSASVNADEGRFHCFTCDYKGDAYDLIMRREGIEFPDAVEFGKRFNGTGNGDVRTVRDRGPYVPGDKGDRPGRRRYIPPGLRRRT